MGGWARPGEASYNPAKHSAVRSCGGHFPLLLEEHRVRNDPHGARSFFLVVLITDAWFTSGTASARSERFQEACMTNRNKKTRITVAGSLPDMVRTQKQASDLLECLRKEYQLLTPENRNQVKCFISERHPPYNPQHAEIESGTLIRQFQKSLMEDEKIYEEKIWSAIRYLDPDEQEKDKEANIATIIAILALLLIVGAVWVFLWFR